VSFRAIKEKRDYMGKRKSASWMYMSRLAAQKEWAFMKVTPQASGESQVANFSARFCTSTASQSRHLSIRHGILFSWSSSTPIRCKRATAGAV
jgi:hypothetical protein